jgi:hypothetical protein
MEGEVQEVECGVQDVEQGCPRDDMRSCAVELCDKTSKTGGKGDGMRSALEAMVIPEAEFLDKIQTKILRFFLLAIHSHLYSFALGFLFLQSHATSYIFLQFSYCNP